MGSADDLTADDGDPGLIVRYGQLCDEELSEAQRADQLTDLLVEVLIVSDVDVRRATSVSGEGPAVALYVDGTPYLLEVTWLADPLTPTCVLAFREGPALP